MNLKMCIIANLPADNQSRYWRLNEAIPTKELIGKYAVVENRNAYALVKIDGVAFFPEKYKRGHKKVVQILELPECTEDEPF